MMNRSWHSLLPLFLIFTLLLSCNKDDDEDATAGNSGNPTSPPASNCATNSGYFTINFGNQFSELVLDSESQYTILYNWFGFEESAFIIDGEDQNSNDMYIELALPGKFKTGVKGYSTDSLNFDFFDFSIDTFSYYVSNVVFDVATSNLDASDGIYKPVNGSFTGIAHSYPWFNGQAPTDTINISGTFCLNGMILP